MLSNNSRTKCCSGLFDALPVSTVLFIWFRYKIGVNNKNYLLITSHSKNENPSPPYIYVCHAHKQFQRTNNRLIIYFMKFVIEAFVKTKIAFHSCNETYPYAHTHTYTVVSHLTRSKEPPLFEDKERQFN